MFVWYVKVYFFVLQENGSSEEHVLYVWDHFVSKAEAKNVFILAHSYGGLSFVELVSVLVFPALFLCLQLTKRHNTLILIACTHIKSALSHSYPQDNWMLQSYPLNQHPIQLQISRHWHTHTQTHLFFKHAEQCQSWSPQRNKQECNSL